MDNNRFSDNNPKIRLYACSLLHAITDGFNNSFYIILPFVAKELNISYSRIGFLKTCLTGTSSFLQIPSGIAAEKIGEILMLSLGAGGLAAGFLLMGFATTFSYLIFFIIIAGTGASVQHPVASSLVSKAYENSRIGTAISTLNFGGDVGKVIVPLIFTFLIASFGWRHTLFISGTLGIGFSILLWLGMRKLIDNKKEKTIHTLPSKTTSANKSSYWGIVSKKRFFSLALIGMIDDSTRTTVLTFLPFLLARKGIPPQRIGFMIALLFLGGAMGKLVCGILSDRYGNIKMVMITEFATSLGIILLLFNFPILSLIIHLPLLGIVLNGTSSVLYSTVAELIIPERRSRGYALYYSIYLSSGALGPLLYGLIGDYLGLSALFITLGFIVSLAAPLAIFLRHPSR